MTNKPVKISNNCWKHTYKNGDFIYTKTYDIISERHREDGPAIEYASGTKKWYVNNQLHREDGPAIEFADGGKEWYINGKRHREDGPAIEFADGYKEWHMNNKRINVNSQEEFELYLKNIIFF